jgi:phosphoribosylpyrophosphate synthetase
VADRPGRLDQARGGTLVLDTVGTGGTLEAVAQLLVERKGIQELHVGVTHCLGLPQAQERLEALHRAGTLARVVITNSVPQTPEFLASPYVHTLDVAEELAGAVAAIHGAWGSGPP